MSTIRFIKTGKADLGPLRSGSYRFSYEAKGYGWNDRGSLESRNVYWVYILVYTESKRGSNALTSMFSESLDFIEITSHAGVHRFEDIQSISWNPASDGEFSYFLSFLAGKIEQQLGPATLDKKKRMKKPIKFNEDDLGRRIRF